LHFVRYGKLPVKTKLGVNYQLRLTESELQMLRNNHYEQATVWLRQ